jgi:hypothetical protein
MRDEHVDVRRDHPPLLQTLLTSVHTVPSVRYAEYFMPCSSARRAKAMMDAYLGKLKAQSQNSGCQGEP